MLVPEPSTSLPTQSAFSILMGVVEVARILRVSRATAYRLVNSGELPSVRMGGMRRIVRVRPADVTRYIERHITNLDL